MNAEEPTAAYYTPSMVHALQRSIANRISHETNPEKESFEERYQKAKEFAYKHFDKEYIQSLEARNFLVDEPFPTEVCETKEDLERLIAESEASGECTQEEIDKMYTIWENVL